MREVKIARAHDGKHKYTAVFFEDGKKIKTTHFGAEGMSDFTKHKDPERKKQYIERHKGKESWENPMSAGALSRWVLWNKPTLSESIESYCKKFRLHRRKG
jgi:hypothetical protein